MQRTRRIRNLLNGVSTIGTLLRQLAASQYPRLNSFFVANNFSRIRYYLLSNHITMVKKRSHDHLWQVGPSRVLFESPIVSFIASEVTSPRTSVAKDFYRFDFPGWVNIVALTPAREIVLIRQYRFGTGGMELEIPGGAIELNEDPLAAGLRELLEETGFSGKQSRIIGQVCPNPAIQSNTCYTVLVENVTRQKAPTLDPMEDIEVLTMPEQDVFKLVRSGEINHGLVLNGLMFYRMTQRNW